MNTEITPEIKDVFSKLFNYNRMPHAVIIEGGSDLLREQAALYLSSWAVCSSNGNDRPCGVCKNCTKALLKSHSDIFYAQSTGKTGIINIETMRKIIMDSNIVANEANTRVFVLLDADKRMKEDVQNAFLKILEEPPQSILFVITCENSKSLLQTIRSRAQIFTLKTDEIVTQECDDLAKDIINGILSVSEIPLLFSTAQLTNRSTAKEVLAVISEYLRKALLASSGAACTDETAQKLAKKLTKLRLIGLIDITSQAIIKADRNINMTVLSTWLCTQYRRISWQR